LNLPSDAAQLPDQRRSSDLRKRPSANVGVKRDECPVSEKICDYRELKGAFGVRLVDKEPDDDRHGNLDAGKNALTYHP
jgi:hypothetical protein